MLECATPCRILQCVVFRKQKLIGNLKHEYLEGFVDFSVRNFTGVLLDEKFKLEHSGADFVKHASKKL